jgi:hypothetical protein
MQADANHEVGQPGIRLPERNRSVAGALPDVVHEHIHCAMPLEDRRESRRDGFVVEQIGFNRDCGPA